MRDVEVLGARLRVDEEGRGDPVLLLHGFSLDLRMWDELAPRLADRHRVIRVDLRGYGRSSLPDGPYRHVDDVAALLLALDAAPAHLVGLSMGGAVALATALAHPEVVRSIVSVAGACTGLRGTKDWSVPGRVARAEGLSAAKIAWMADPLFASVAADPVALARMRRSVDDYTGFHWLGHDPGTSVAAVADRLGELAVPVLALVGELDHADFHEVAQRLEERAPNARRVVLDGVGHLPPLEAPERTADAILGFLVDA